MKKEKYNFIVSSFFGFLLGIEAGIDQNIFKYHCECIISPGSLTVLDGFMYYTNSVAKKIKHNNCCLKIYPNYTMSKE